MVNVFFVSLLEIVIFCDIKSHHIQDLQQVMVSGPNLNETSIVSGGYGGAAEGIIPTSSIKGKEHLNSSSVWFWSDLMQLLIMCLARFSLHLCWRICLGPAIRFNPEYFDRRCGNVPKPGVCILYMHDNLTEDLILQSLSLQLPLSPGVKWVCQHFNGKRLAFFYRVLGTVAWWMHVWLCNINLLFVLNLL